LELLWQTDMVCCICPEVFGKRRRAVVRRLSQEFLLACKIEEEDNGSSDSKRSNVHVFSLPMHCFRSSCSGKDTTSDASPRDSKHENSYIDANGVKKDSDAEDEARLGSFHVKTTLRAIKSEVRQKGTTIAFVGVIKHPSSDEKRRGNR
jgi:hypothetical protein